jgi:hypothetical protein
VRRLHLACASVAKGAKPSECGQTLVLLLGSVFVLVFGIGVLGALGKALLGKGRYQRAADLAAVSAARSMRDDFTRLFEPAVDERGEPNPRHLEKGEYLSRARATAVEIARLNGADADAVEVRFPDVDSFAPLRVRVALRGAVSIRPTDAPTERIGIRARAEAELTPPASVVSRPDLEATGGGYSGPLSYRQGKSMRPDVALAFDRMAAAARRDGVSLIVTSGYRSDAEQAELYRRHPDPKWVAPPGRSLHRLGTELDLGPPSAYGWLARNAGRFHFVQRYSWEPWHFGYTLNSRSTPDSYRGAGRAGDGRSAVPAFVPARFEAPIARAASRWNVSAALLAAQLYVESNFNPFAVSRAGARGIAQFMPGTARVYGLRNPLDPEAAIDAQAHLMRDLLRRFGSVPLALAGYNAGAGAVDRCGCIPPYPETQAYVARILGLMGGAGASIESGVPDGDGGALEVHLTS